jgi:hypothetical protein
MMKNSFFKISNLKNILLVLFSLLIVLSVSILITTEVIKLYPKSIQQSIADRFNKIKVQLEFSGFTSKVKEMTEDYPRLFDGFNNVIITDDNGKILYSVNDGYISEKNKFLVIIDPWKANEFGNNIAYLIDSKNNIKYSTQLEIYLNLNKLKEQSSKNPLSKALFSKTQDMDDYIGYKEKANSEGSSYVISSETNIIMNYEYIASKGLNLYSIYDSNYQYHNYYTFTNFLKIVRRCLIIFTIVLLTLFCALLTLWVFKDAKKRNLNAARWAIITFIANIFGLGIYLIFRPKNIKCVACNNTIEDNWILCPHCGEKVNIHMLAQHK